MATPKKEREPNGWKPVFLETLRSSGNVRHACTKAGIHRSAAYKAKCRDAEFSEQWDFAIEDAVDALVLEATRRASQGVEKPIFFQGREVARVREYSDNLLMFLLKGLRPEMFRDATAKQIAEELERRMGSEEPPAPVSPKVDGKGRKS